MKVEGKGFGGGKGRGCKFDGRVVVWRLLF